MRRIDPSRPQTGRRRFNPEAGFVVPPRFRGIHLAGAHLAAAWRRGASWPTALVL